MPLLRPSPERALARWLSRIDQYVRNADPRQYRDLLEDAVRHVPPIERGEEPSVDQVVLHLQAQWLDPFDGDGDGGDE